MTVGDRNNERAAGELNLEDSSTDERLPTKTNINDSLDELENGDEADSASKKANPVSFQKTQTISENHELLEELKFDQGVVGNKDFISQTLNLPRILLVDGSIQSAKLISSFQTLLGGHSLLILARGFSPEVIDASGCGESQVYTSVSLVKIPAKKKDIFSSIAALTDGTILDDKKEVLANITSDMLGFATKVTLTAK